LLAYAVGIALQVVLNTLNPAERLAFVLHDMFAVPFHEIAATVDRTPAAARQPRAPPGGERRRRRTRA
jgi:RNA polymerase sigma-70 factor (ECF subfamily)